jgi:hypothetical protein
MAALASGALEPYLSVRGLGTKTRRKDDRVARVRNAARLLASVAGGVEPEAGAPRTRPESRLLAAHACHGCFSPGEAATLARLAEEHTLQHGWLTKRHSEHPTTDFSLLDAPALWAFAEPLVTQRVLTTMRLLFFGAVDAPVDLVINDLFYARYDSIVGWSKETDGHARMHGRSQRKREQRGGGGGLLCCRGAHPSLGPTLGLAGTTGTRRGPRWSWSRTGTGPF